MKKILFFIFLFLFVLVKQASAHCPLCTVGAAAVAGTAAYFGVDLIVIGLFIGAFATSLGFWISNVIKRKFFSFQKPIIILLSFLTTVLPLIPLISNEHAVYPLYISFFGDYGSLFNRTYLLDQFLVGSLIGGVIVCITPFISKKITQARAGRTIPFQGTLLTLLILVIAGIAFQVVLR